MFFEDIFRRLQTNNVNYLVVGGVALMLHGVIRMTADLDLMVALREDNLRRFVAIMNELGFQPKGPVPADNLLSEENRRIWAIEKNMQVFSFYHPEQVISLIDVFVTEPIPFSELMKTSVLKSLGDVAIPVVSIQDLIRLKKMAGRPQDLEDIKALEMVLKQ